MLLSVVIPVYKAEEIIEELINRIKNSLEFTSGNYQLILVDDGSYDNSWTLIESICIKQPQIKAIKLSRNFGQHHAITAGLDYCNGDWIVVMDCDLQDKPEEIIHLYQKAQQGFDIVLAQRNNRTDSFWKKILSKLFYQLYSYLTGIKNDGTVANFGIYSKKVIDAIKEMKETMRAFSPMVRWVGFDTTTIKVEHGERFAGKTTYNLRKLFNLALDIILSYSDKPLKIIVRLGFFISLMAFMFALYIFYRYCTGKITVTGYTSIIISIWFLGGLVIMILGVLGLYIAKIFAGVKNRPLYIVDKKINIS
jgi:polyisoprenyl-phosphate glycosyltransferase